MPCRPGVAVHSRLVRRTLMHAVNAASNCSRVSFWLIQNTPALLVGGDLRHDVAQGEHGREQGPFLPICIPDAVSNLRRLLAQRVMRSSPLGCPIAMIRASAKRLVFSALWCPGCALEGPIGLLDLVFRTCRVSSAPSSVVVWELS